MDNIIFEKGKYKGKTYREVRVNHTDYFLWLFIQPAGSVYNYFDFIKYCMGYISRD